MGDVVFLDRDGVINEERAAYVRSVEDFKVFPYTPSAIARLNGAGYRVAVVSNQQGVAKGLMSTEDLAAMESALNSRLDEVGAAIVSYRYCTHLASDRCRCRKPQPGMILETASKLGVDPRECFMVGDSECDMQAGKAAGCRTIFVRSGLDIARDTDLIGALADHVVSSLPEAVDVILASRG